MIPRGPGASLLWSIDTPPRPATRPIDPAIIHGNVHGRGIERRQYLIWVALATSVPDDEVRKMTVDNAADFFRLG